MHALFALNHPSQYHVFKNLADKLLQSGHEVSFIIKKNKDMLEDLLIADHRSYRYSASAKSRSGSKILLAADAIRTIISQEFSTLSLVRKKKVHFLAGTDIAISHIGKIYNIPSFVVCEDDYELIKLFGNLAYPFTKHIISPFSCSLGRWEHKRLGYWGSQKSAYLHPNSFMPDKMIPEKYGLSGTKYFILRLVSMKAYHDILNDTEPGINISNVIKLVDYLKKKGRIIITSQVELPVQLQTYQLDIDPKDIHNLLYFADLFIGDSQSMTVESALLGTPAIRMNKWVIELNKVSVLEELEHKYGLCFGIPPDQIESLIQKIDEIFSLKDYKKIWVEKRREYFNENTDLTSYLFWLITNYPESIEIAKNKETIQEMFISTRSNSLDKLP